MNTGKYPSKNNGHHSVRIARSPFRGIRITAILIASFLYFTPSAISQVSLASRGYLTVSADVLSLGSGLPGITVSRIWPSGWMASAGVMENPFTDRFGGQVFEYTDFRIGVSRVFHKERWVRDMFSADLTLHTGWYDIRFSRKQNGHQGEFLSAGIGGTWYRRIGNRWLLGVSLAVGPWYTIRRGYYTTEHWKYQIYDGETGRDLYFFPTDGRVSFIYFIPMERRAGR